MLLGARNSLVTFVDEGKLPDGVCFYFEGVPAGSIFYSYAKVGSDGVPWTIDYGDGTVTEYSTTATAASHTYTDGGDFVITIKGEGITYIKPSGLINYPLFKAAGVTEHPYIRKVTVGDDFTVFPLGAYSALGTTISGTWLRHSSNFDGIYISKKVTSLSTDVGGQFAYLGYYGPVDFSCSGIKNLLAPNMFRYAKYIDLSALPRTQTSLDEYYLFGATNLTSLAGIPQGVTGKIGMHCFRGCSLLKDISDIPSGVNELGSYAFAACTSLESADLPQVTTLGTFSFQGCTSLKEARFENATSVGYSSFSGCRELTDVYVKYVGRTSVTSSNNSLFGPSSRDDLVLHLLASSIPSCNCCYDTYLKNVDLVNATSVGSNAFSYCTSLVKVDGFGKVKNVAATAFGGCTSLDISTMDLSGVEGLGDFAFSNTRVDIACSEVYLPNVNTIGSYALGLETDTSATLHIGNKLIQLSPNAFMNGGSTQNCIRWANIVFDEGSRFSCVGDRSIVKDGNTLVLCLYDTEIPQGITVIGESACARGNISSLVRSERTTFRTSCFNGCYLDVVDIENAVIGSSYGVFSSCAAKTISVKMADDSRLLDGSGDLFSYSKSLTSLYCECGNGGMFGTFVARNCTALKTATLCVGHTITTAGAPDRCGMYGSAFSGCTSLEYVYLPNLSGILNAVGLGALASEFFKDCTSMKEVHFGVAHKAEITKHSAYSTLFGLTTSYTGKIYFDLNPDGSVATNEDGSPIEPYYDGSQS